MPRLFKRLFGQGKAPAPKFRFPPRDRFSVLPPSPKLAPKRGGPVTWGHVIDRILFALILALLALIFADLGLNDGDALLFLMRELVDLVDYLIFWR